MCHPACSRCRTLLLVLSFKLLSPVISLSSYISLYALSTGSESLNASNTSSSHLLTKFSQLPNLHHNLISVQRPCSTRCSSYIRRYCCSATVTILSNNNRSLLCFTLSLESTPCISSSTCFVPVPSFPIHLFLHPSLPLLIYDSAYQ